MVWVLIAGSCVFAKRTHKFGIQKVDGGIGLRCSVLFHVFVKSDHESWAEPGLSFLFFRSKGGRFCTETWLKPSTICCFLFGLFCQWSIDIACPFLSIRFEPWSFHLRLLMPKITYFPVKFQKHKNLDSMPKTCTSRTSRGKGVHQKKHFEAKFGLRVGLFSPAFVWFFLNPPYS